MWLYGEVTKYTASELLTYNMYQAAILNILTNKSFSHLYFVDQTSIQTVHQHQKSDRMKLHETSHENALWDHPMSLYNCQLLPLMWSAV